MQCTMAGFFLNIKRPFGIYIYIFITLRLYLYNMKTQNDTSAQRIRIKDWAKEDRPRERMMEKGATALSNAELIAILLGSGSQRESALDLAKRILDDVQNNLSELGKRSASDYCRIYSGIGPAKAVRVVAAMELGKRRRASETLPRKQIRNSRDIYELIHTKLIDLPHEECWVVLMNNQHKVLDTIRISHGGVSETTVDPKIVLKHALDKLASSIILCHNHPSGNPRPSSCDDRITKKIQSACSHLDIQFTDHLVFCEDGYYSYADEGKL